MKTCIQLIAFHESQQLFKITYVLIMVVQELTDCSLCSLPTSMHNAQSTNLSHVCVKSCHLHAQGCCSCPVERSSDLRH